MGRWRVFLFLGLALWAMTVPVLAAELPADVENALPRTPDGCWTAWSSGTQPA